MKLSKEPIVGRGQELIQKALADYSIPFTTESDRLIFALRSEDHNPSVHAEVSRDGGWVDFGDPSKEGKGDAFDLIARLSGLDSKKDFNSIIKKAYEYLQIPMPTANAVEAPTTTKEDLAARYGLEVSDFTSAGVTEGKKWVKELKAEAECVIYPLQSPNGQTVLKWKTFSRNAKGKRMVGAEKDANLASCLFGQPIATATGKTLILNGGEEKCLASIKAALPDTVSVSSPNGEKITHEIATWIGECKPKKVIVAFDNDKSGRDGTLAAAKLLHAVGIEDVQTVVWPKGAKPSEDLNDRLKNGGPTGLRVLLTQTQPVEQTGLGGLPLPLLVTDTANSVRFVAKFKGQFLYDATKCSWMIYDGKRWVPDIGAHCVKHSGTTVSRIILEEASVNFLMADELTKWAVSSAMANRINSMVDTAKNRPDIKTETAQYDTQETFFNVQNGTLDVRTGELRPHSREDKITKIANADYDPDAECPTWKSFLHRSFDGNWELIEFMQRAIGYSMTALTSEQCMFILHGAGANGKSTFLETLRWLFGDYGIAGEPKTFLHDEQGTPASAARPDLIQLIKTRFVTLTEIDKGKRLDESTVKALTGQDSRSIRDLYSSSIQWIPTMKLFLASNHKPDVRGADEGIWRRIHLIPFEVIVPPNERDGTLPAKLRAEANGILRWAVEGAKKWFETGLRPPDIVRAATREYREESDTLAPFMQECCMIEKNASERANFVYTNYTEWCRRANETPMKQRTFGIAIKERGFQTRKGTRGVRWYVGFRLLDTGENPSQDGGSSKEGPDSVGFVRGRTGGEAEGGRMEKSSATHNQVQQNQLFTEESGRSGRTSEESDTTRVGAHAHAHTHTHTRGVVSPDILPLAPLGHVNEDISDIPASGRTKTQSATHLPLGDIAPLVRPPWPQYGWHPDTPLSPTDSKDSSRDN